MKPEGKEVAKQVGSEVARVGLKAFFGWVKERPRVKRILVKLGVKR